LRKKSNQLDIMDMLTPNHKTRVPVGVYTRRYLIEYAKRGQDYVPVYVPFVDHRAIQFIARIATERIFDLYDCIFLITGQRRTGKSTLALQIAQGIDKNFSADDVVFRLEEFHQRLNQHVYANPQMGVFPQIELDEAGFDLFAQEWQHSPQRDVVKTLEVIGAKRICLYFLAPHREKLNRGVREEMCYIWIDTNPNPKLGPGRGYAELRIGQVNKWHQEQRWKPQCAFFFDELVGPLWDQYSQKKTDFIGAVSRMNVQNGTESLAESVTGLDRNVVNSTAFGPNIRQIASKNRF